MSPSSRTPPLGEPPAPWRSREVRAALLGPLDFCEHRAGEGRLAISGKALPIGSDHHGIRCDDLYLVIGLTRRDVLPGLILTKFGRRDSVRRLQRESTLRERYAGQNTEGSQNDRRDRSFLHLQYLNSLAVVGYCKVAVLLRITRASFPLQLCDWNARIESPGVVFPVPPRGSITGLSDRRRRVCSLH